MKILFVIHKIKYSGAPKMMTWIANKMSENGHNVYYISLFGSDVQQEISQGVNLVLLNCKQSKSWFKRNTIDMINALFKLQKHIRLIKPDFLVSFVESVSYIYIPLNKLLSNIKVVVSERVDPYTYKGWRLFIRKFILGCSDSIVFQTEGARNFFDTKISKKSVVIPNPIVTTDELLMAQSKRNIDNISNEVVSVGRLNIAQKRQDVLIDAFDIVLKSHPEYVLKIYGDGDDREEIEDKIEKMNISNSVILMGQSNNIPKAIMNATCFVLSSDYEGIPNALMEAMAIGLPCVSTDCRPGGAKLLIDNEKNGFIVPCACAEALADKINWVIENKYLSYKIGENAKNICIDYSESQIMREWNVLFELQNDENTKLIDE